jgi:hypothetical protein
MPKSVIRILSVTILTLIALSAVGQQVRPVDPSRFAKPEPICAMRGEVVRDALQLVVTTLQRAKLHITQTNWDLGQAEANAIDTDGENRVIVWLEWDIAKPGHQFKIFFIGARYEKFFGKTELQRILLNSTDEEKHFGAVRAALIAAAFEKG